MGRFRTQADDASRIRPCRQVVTLASACKLWQGSDKGVPNRKHAARGESSQPNVRHEHPQVHAQQIGTTDGWGLGSMSCCDDMFGGLRVFVHAALCSPRCPSSSSGPYGGLYVWVVFATSGPRHVIPNSHAGCNPSFSSGPSHEAVCLCVFVC